MNDSTPVSSATATWQERLDDIMAMMRELSLQEDAQKMVRAYGERMRKLLPLDRWISLSRRDLEEPEFRITRYSEWEENINPWKQSHRLPLLKGGILSELIYGDAPRLIDDLTVDPSDPAAAYLEGQRSLMAIPMLDKGQALNMVIVLRSQPYAFDREQFPEIVWTSNLFGRVTYNLVLAGQVREAYDIVDRELQAVADIQRALLPHELPEIPTLQLAVRYLTSAQAGGDYYDFFPLCDNRWGILMADVSGHGTPAAVMMAITHCISHMYPGLPNLPERMLGFVNEHLTRLYTNKVGTFVTAFFGVYDPATHILLYSSAGHNPPRIKRCREGGIDVLHEARQLPLGVSENVVYTHSSTQLRPGDQLILYTDGITEATNRQGEMFGVQRLDELISCCRDEPEDVVTALMTRLQSFTEGVPSADDQTVVAVRVRE